MYSTVIINSRPLDLAQHAALTYSDLHVESDIGLVYISLRYMPIAIYREKYSLHELEKDCSKRTQHDDDILEYPSIPYITQQSRLVLAYNTVYNSYINIVHSIYQITVTTMN